MDVTSGGELYVVGETKSSDLDVFERSAAYWQDELANGYGDGHSNAFVFSLDSDLEKKWITYFGGYASTSSPISIDIPWGITVSSDDLSMFMSGETSNDEYFPLWDAGNGAYWQPDMLLLLLQQSDGFGNEELRYRDAFICKFDISPNLSVNDFSDENSDELIVFPNPSSEEIWIRLDGSVGVFTITVYNALGMAVSRSNNHHFGLGNFARINVSQLSAGPYSVEVTSNTSRLVKKFVISENR